MFRSVIVVVIAFVGILSGCATSVPRPQTFTRDQNDTFAFVKLSKRIMFGVNAILRTDTTLVLVTNQDIFRSSNSGATWGSLAEPLSHKNITAVEAHGDTIYAGSGHSTVYRTTDHGLQWRVVQRTGIQPIRGFDRNAEPLSSDNLNTRCWPRPSMTITHTDSVLRYVHWSGVTRSITLPDLAEARPVVSSDSVIVLATRTNDVIVYRPSTASTEHYTPRILNGQAVSALALRGDTLYVGTKLSLGGVFRIVLGTTTWEQMLVDRIEGALDVHALSVNDRALYVASREHAVLSVPYGSNILRSLSDGINLALHQSVSKLGDSWIVSSRLKGALAFNANGDGLRIVSSTAPTSSEYVVTTLGSNIVMGLADGTMLLSADTGATWQVRSKSFGQSELTSFRVFDSTLYACTASGLYVSKDSARSFTVFMEVLHDENIQSVTRLDSLMLVFASSGTYTVDHSGQLGLFSPGVEADYQVRVNDATTHNGVALAAGYPGLFTSTDGGTTWELTTIPKAMVLRTVYCDADNVYVIGDDGDMYVSPMPKWMQQRQRAN